MKIEHSKRIDDLHTRLSFEDDDSRLEQFENTANLNYYYADCEGNDECESLVWLLQTILNAVETTPTLLKMDACWIDTKSQLLVWFGTEEEIVNKLTILSVHS